MANCNPRALFVYASISSFTAEVCFLSILFLEAEIGKQNANNSCWSNFESDSAKDEARCPFFVLFLATIVNGLLLLYTGSFLLARLLGSRECSLKRIPFCRILLRYGSFFTNLLTTLLISTFIGLLIGFKSRKNYAGEIFDHHRRIYFVVICAGFVLMLIASVTSGIQAFQRRREGLDDEFENAINRSFSDSYVDIN